MFLYAIKHRTRGYIPLVKSSASYAEPSHDAVPRLFLHRHLAKLTLKTYLRGTWEKVYADDQRDLGSRPQVGTARNAEDFEIVLMVLTEMK
jgi:hypothetical protein